MTTTIKLSDIKVDPEIQLRERRIDNHTVSGYIEAVANGAEFPPVDIFQDADGYLWLGDGFHRISAYRFLGKVGIEADVRPGTRQDAMVHAATANVANGKPMSQAEKREAGERLLRLTTLNQAEIARRLAVSEMAVSKWKLSLNMFRDKVEVTRNGGQPYQMDTTNIGKRGNGQQEQPEDNRPLFANDPDLDDSLKDEAEPVCDNCGQVYSGASCPDCNPRHGIVTCSNCGQIYDGDMFSTGCPYCWKEKHNFESWTEGLPEMIRADTNSDKSLSQPMQIMLSHESVEYYTPSEYIEAARQVMGGIDLDPASCNEAQQTIKANKFYTKEDDGLSLKWHGRIWLNPPYSKTDGRSNQELWAERLLQEYEASNVTEGVLLVKSALGYNWFENLWDKLPACFVRQRLSFTKTDGSSDGQSKHGTTFFYVGTNVERFINIFSTFGRITTPDGRYVNGAKN